MRSSLADGPYRVRMGVFSDGVVICPTCRAPLAIGATEAACPSGHRFDRARQGYLNVLVGGRRPSSKVRGDDPEALRARRRFLAAGHYHPISESVRHMIGDARPVVVDLGCGEGSYTAELSGECVIGVDVSKPAIKMAAVLVPAAGFLVASSYALPIADASVDVAVSIFAPRPADELARIVRPGGCVVTVSPAAGHLAELVGHPRRDDLAAKRATPPPHADTAERVTFVLDVATVDVAELVAMTPLGRHVTDARPTTASHVTVDVWVTRQHRR